MCVGDQCLINCNNEYVFFHSIPILTKVFYKVTGKTAKSCESSIFHLEIVLQSNNKNDNRLRDKFIICVWSRRARHGALQRRAWRASPDEDVHRPRIPTSPPSPRPLRAELPSSAAFSWIGELARRRRWGSRFFLFTQSVARS